MLPPASAAPRFGQVCCSSASLQRHGNLKKTPPSKHPIDFAQKQLSKTLSSPVMKARMLVCNAIICSAIAAVQLSERISKWIARHGALVHTGAPAVMRTQLLLGHTHNRAAGEQRHRIERKFPSVLWDFCWFEFDHRRLPSQQDVGKVRTAWEGGKAGEVFLQTLQKECLYD